MCRGKMPVMVASDDYEGGRKTTAVDAISTIEKRGYSARRRGMKGTKRTTTEKKSRRSDQVVGCRLVGRRC
jgi:hypothetical protein